MESGGNTVDSQKPTVHNFVVGLVELEFLVTGEWFLVQKMLILPDTVLKIKDIEGEGSENVHIHITGYPN